MRCKIKICGITNLQDALFAEACGADFLGFIFAKTSPRYITTQAAAKIITQLTKAKAVGVFIEQDDAEITHITQQCQLNFIQVYRQTFAKHAKTIGVLAIEQSSHPPFSADYYLYDNINQHSYGGNGKPFNWSRLPKDLSRAFVAGGISSHNIGKLITEHNPYAVDLCSSVESYPGKKQPEKLIEFFHKVKTL